MHTSTPHKTHEIEPPVFPKGTDEQTYAVIGAAMNVHRELGFGFVEAVYQEALEFEFLSRKIPFENGYAIPVHFRGTVLRTKFKADFLCYGKLIVELKALPRISGVEESQLINYLKATDQRIGLLLNFGSRRLEYKRLVFG